MKKSVRLLGLVVSFLRIATEFEVVDADRPTGGNEVEFVKYPLYDSYVRSCHQKEQNFGYQKDLEVRRYRPAGEVNTYREGSLYPYDQDPMSGWCGEEVTGDRVTFLTFDIADFS